MSSETTGWLELGVIKTAIDTSRSPVVVRVTQSARDKENSFEFVVFQSGRIKPVRHWRTKRAMKLSILMNAVSQLLLMTTMLGGDLLSMSTFRILIQENHQLQMVDESIPESKLSPEKVTMTLGERANERKRGRKC